MADIDAAQLALLSIVVSLMLEDDGERTAEDREHLASCSERHGNRDARANGLMACDDEDGRNDGCQGGIWCHGSTDVHPSQCDHFKCTTDNDAGRDIAEDESRERASDERTMRLKLIENGAHAGNSRHNEDCKDLQTAKFHDVPLQFLVESLLDSR